MAVSTGMALATGLGASALGQVLGGSKKSTSTTSSPQGFDALPKAVQEAWLNVALPKIMDTANRPYQAPPMQRVSAPSSIYDSQGLYDLQKYSDSVGGFFSPLARQQPAAQAPAQPQGQPQLSQDDFMALIRSIDPNFGMTNNSGQRMGGTYAQNQESQRMAIESAFKKYGGR